MVRTGTGGTGTWTQEGHCAHLRPERGALDGAGAHSTPVLALGCESLRVSSAPHPAVSTTTVKTVCADSRCHWAGFHVKKLLSTV